MKKFVLAFVCMLGIWGTEGRCELARFVGSGPDQWAVVMIDSGTATTAYRALSTRSADVTLDSDNQTITYNSLSFDIPNQTIIQRSQTGVIPGTFKSVTLQHTLTLNPFHISVSNVGPLDLTVAGNHFNIEDNRDGAKGAFSSLSLSGIYHVEGPTESYTVPFSYTVPVSNDQKFPWSRLFVDDYPNSIGLGPWLDSVSFRPVPDLFTGTVDGLPSAFGIEKVDFYENLELTLHAVPEPSTVILWSLAGLVGGFVTWRKRRG
jgi:hypothetical protein